MRVRITYECWVEISDDYTAAISKSSELIDIAYEAVYEAAMAKALEISSDRMELIDVAYEDADGDIVYLS